jgi:hypothetical protein
MYCLIPQEWKGDVQVMGRRPSSYVVVRKASDGEDWTVAPTATNSYVFTDQDETLSRELWHWSHSLIRKNATIKAEHRFTLADIARLEEQEDHDDKVRDRDLTVMVTGKYPYPTEERTGVTPCGFLRVWDGTGVAPSDPYVLYVYWFLFVF